MESIIQSEKECLICKTTKDLHLHHIFGASNRNHSTKYGLTCFLCAYHHNMSDEGVHFKRETDIALKEYAQRKFEAKWGTREDFRRIFGKSWL